MAFNFGIRFSVKDYQRWTSALLRVKRRLIAQSRTLPKDCATEYYQLVHKNIMSQRYAGSYPKYTKEYAKWKAKVATTMDFWRLYDALIRNLQAFKVKSDSPGETAYMGGIPPHVTYGGKPIAMYGSAVEMGKFSKSPKTLKPRPVFWPTALEYAAKKWKERNYQSLNKIKESWR